MSVGQPWSQALIHLGWGMPTKERIQQAGVNLGSCGNAQVCPLGEGFNAVSHTQSSDGRPQKMKYLEMIQCSLQMLSLP